MIAESIQIAASAKGNKVKLVQTAVLSPKTLSKTNTDISSSWVHRYFSFGNQDGESVCSRDSKSTSILV